MKVWVPADSSARALDADLIAEQFVHLSAERDLAITLVRNGSRGMTWLAVSYTHLRAHETR